MKDKTYIEIMQRNGNVLMAGVPLKHICRFVWRCPVCGSEYEQFTKYLSSPRCPTCDHKFGSRDYVNQYEPYRLFPTICERDDFDGKPLGVLLPVA